MGNNFQKQNDKKTEYSESSIMKYINNLLTNKSKPKTQESSDLTINKTSQDNIIIPQSNYKLSNYDEEISNKVSEVLTECKSPQRVVTPNIESNNMTEVYEDMMNMLSGDKYRNEEEISNKVSEVLTECKLPHRVLTPEKKQEYDEVYETMLNMFTVDKDGNKIKPKYTYNEGIDKIFKNQ